MESLSLADRLVDTLSEIEDKVFYSQLWDAVKAALSTVPRQDYDIFMSRYYDEQKVLVIAENYDISTHAVRRACQRCLSKLRRNIRIQKFYI